MKEKCREKCREMLVGEITITKKVFWLILVISTLVGVLIGFLKAPLTHGVTFFCGNGNGNGWGMEEMKSALGKLEEKKAEKKADNEAKKENRKGSKCCSNKRK